MKTNNPRMAKLRERNIAAGLIPLRQSEIWCVSLDEKKEMQLEIAIAIAKVKSKYMPA